MVVVEVLRLERYATDFDRGFESTLRDMRECVDLQRASMASRSSASSPYSLRIARGAIANLFVLLALASLHPLRKKLVEEISAAPEVVSQFHARQCALWFHREQGIAFIPI